ncbi:hypothetical protein NMY22_g6424 [Coprinellus aureogranulatus]|nr:hypothetical protein NMY22_g6424 [Coprinellus aureogranulatus]
MNQDLLAQLAPWKQKKFRERPSELPLQEVVNSIENGEPIVYVVPNKNKDRWVLYRKDLKKPALLCYAGVWLWGTPFETGNYVPEGKTKQPDLPLSRVQNTPSHLCEVSYTIDTSEDHSLYDYAKILDSLVQENAEFKDSCEGKPQSTFQNGENAGTNHRYIMTARLFMYKTPHYKASKLKYPLHPWIKEAVDQKDPRLAPNKGRPRMLDWTGNRWRTVEDTDEDRFKKDEIIWWCFAVVYTIRSQFWVRDLVPVSFVRVGRLDSGSRAIYPPMDTEFDFGELGDDEGEKGVLEPGGDNESEAQDRVDFDGGLSDGEDFFEGKKRKRVGNAFEEDQKDEEHREMKKIGKKRSVSSMSTENDVKAVERGVSKMDIDDMFDGQLSDVEENQVDVPAQKKRLFRRR